MSSWNTKKIKCALLTIIKFVLVLSMLLIDFNNVLSAYKGYNNLKSNIKFLVNAIYTSLPILILVIVYMAYKVLNKKWIFRVERLNLGGMSIIFDNPEKLFEQQVKNFLNTKRTLFKIDENNDNFYETLNSYYSVYNFLREEIKVFDPKSSVESKKYKIANGMIEKLNNFLTSNQNDFRRWYEYMIDKKNDEIYDIDIGEIQKEYRKYSSMIQEFKRLNEYFCEAGKEFKIDTEKWGILSEMEEGNL